MKTLTLLARSAVCLAIVILPAVVKADTLGKTHTAGLGWIGAYLTGTDNEVTVAGVIRDGPADKAGLRAGDVVAKADDKTVRSPAELSAIVRDRAAGRDLSLRVRRDGREETVTVKVAERPDWFAPPGPAWPGRGWLRGNPQGEWRWEWPPKGGGDSDTMDRLQKQFDKLRKQLDELREKFEKHLSSKEPSRI